jgi:hypothetical protein
MVRDNYKVSFLCSSRDHAKAPKYANAIGTVPLSGRSMIRQELATWQHAGFLIGWFSTQKTEVLRSSETLFHVRTIWRDSSEDGNFHM